VRSSQLVAIPVRPYVAMKEKASGPREIRGDTAECQQWSDPTRQAAAHRRPRQHQADQPTH